jgi:hypothetical protein
VPTREKQTANPAKGPDPPDPKPAPLPQIKPLRDYLSAAYAAERANIEPATMVVNGVPVTTKFAISIIAIDGTGDHYAGVNDNLMYYSGSLVKVAALYAAHDLRAQARLHAATQTFADLATFRTSLASVVNPTGAIPRLRAMSVGLRPSLKDILGGFRPSGPNKVEFLSAYRGHLNNVFENAGARGIIRPLGYSFINVSMIRSNFFDSDPSKLNGIWLAGDYSGDLPAVQRLAVKRVPVVNDSDPDGGAQAITTKEMSRMFRLMHSKTGFAHITDPAERDAANQDMHDILTPGDSFGPSPYPVPGKFSRHCGKVGIGNLGPVDTPGPRVFSEGSVMRWTTPPTLVGSFNTTRSRSLTGDFVLVWQGLYGQGTSWNAMVRLVTSAMENFLTQS